MNVVHVINSEQVGGAERFLVHLWRAGRATPDLQPELWVIRRRGRDSRRDLLDAADAAAVPARIFPARGNLDPSLPGRLVRALRDRAPDAVHTHLVLSQLVGRGAALRAGVPVIVSSEQNVYEAKARFPLRSIERGLSSRCARVIACSRAVRDHLVERVGVPADRVVVCPNTIDPADYEDLPDESTPTLRRDPGERVIGTVGRLHPQKGHDLLLEAFAALDPAARRLRLAIVGEGPLEGDLRRRARDLAIADRVEFVPWQRRIAATVRRMDLFAFPSRFEGFGVALLEAMWLGLPAVAARVGGIPEFAVDGDTALLVPPGDVAGLAGALDALVEDEPTRRRMGDAAHRRAAEFTVDRLTDRIPGFYQSPVTLDRRESSR